MEKANTSTTSAKAVECSNNHNHTNGSTSSNRVAQQSSTNNESLSAISSFLTNLSYHSMIKSSLNLFARSKSYASSLRPGSFVSSLVPVLLGTVLAFKATGQFSLTILVGTIVTVVGVHAAGNLVNTYHDYKHGIDSKPKSEDRTLVDHILTTEEVVNLGVVFYLIACFGFLVVWLSSPAPKELLALIYFGGISSSFLYTGGLGLKYIAMGDIIIMITFGPVSVLYSFIAQTGTYRLVTILYAIPLALNAEAIMHSNNTRDIEDDRKAGCVTIAMLIGHTASHVLFALLLFVPYLMFVFAMTYLRSTLWFLLPLLTIFKALKLEKHFRANQLSHLPKDVAELSAYFGLFYLVACFMSSSDRLPGLLTHL